MLIERKREHKFILNTPHTQPGYKKKRSHYIVTAPRILNVINYTLISTSTPLGNSNFIRASTVFDVEL